MRNYVINGKDRGCFVVKKGEVCDIVIPIDSLAYVDMRRLHKMESKGDELMRTMRETTLDNGKNALKLYADILIDVRHPEPTHEPTPQESLAAAKELVAEAEVKEAEAEAAMESVRAAEAEAVEAAKELIAESEVVDVEVDGEEESKPVAKKKAPKKKSTQ